MPKKRNLNMEEKRNLQKLLLADIETAEQTYQTRRRTEREALDDQLVASPPPEVAALFNAYKEATRTIHEKEEALAQQGYRCIGSGDDERLDTHYSPVPAALREFDAETKRGEQRYAALKREYTLRLFAGGEEARGLFSTLAQDIASVA